MAITVRELVTKLTVDGSDAQAKLGKFGLAVDGIKAGLDIMVGALKFATAATFGLVDSVTAVGAAISDTAKTVGLGTTEFQRLKFIAEQTGTPLGNLVKGLQNIQRNMRDAALAAGKGQKTGFSRALDEVGLSLKDLEGLDAEQRFAKIGQALSNIDDAGRRVALSQKLIGEEAGPKMAGLLKLTRGEIKALGDEAERLGIVMDKKAIKKSEDFQESLDKLKAVIKGIKRTIAIEFVPIVKKAVDQFKTWVIANKDFIKLKVGDVIRALLKVFSKFLDNIDNISKAMLGLISAAAGIVGFFVDFADAVGGVSKALQLATAGILTFKLLLATLVKGSVAAAFGPFGVIGFGLLAVAAAFIDIETAADKARIANDKFNKGNKVISDEPADDALATETAIQLAKSARSGKSLDPLTRVRLGRQLPQQTALAFAIARKILAGQLTTGGALATIRSGARAPKAGPRATRLINKIEQDIVEAGRSRRALEEQRFAREEAGPEVDATLAHFGIGPGQNPPGGGGGGGGTGTTPDKLSFAELIAQAIQSGTLPESAALLASTQPPIIIPITNIQVNMEVDATTNIEGVPGEDVETFGERVREIFTESLGTEMRTAMDELRPLLAR